MITSAILAGGGTAGHVNPLLAVADEIRRRNPDASIIVLGTETGLEADIVPQRGYRLWTIPRVPLPRRPSAALLTLPGKLSQAVGSARRAITETRADVVIGFGGYVSTPAYLAARKTQVPVVIHEQNARPGLANRLGSRWAVRVGVTFPGTPLRGATVTGLPLRPEIAALVKERTDDGGAAAVRASAAAALGLDPALPTIVVTGGSLGALSVNTAVAGAAPELTHSAQVLHLTGKKKDAAVTGTVDAVLHGEARARYHVRDYLVDMHLALAVADLVIARSGAGTVCELAALGIPAVYVPLPIGNGEQRLNAAPVVDAGGGLMVEDKAFTSHWVAETVPALVADTQRLASMAETARRFGIRDGASRVVDLAEAAITRKAVL